MTYKQRAVPGLTAHAFQMKVNYEPVYDIKIPLAALAVVRRATFLILQRSLMGFHNAAVILIYCYK